MLPIRPRVDVLKNFGYMLENLVYRVLLVWYNDNVCIFLVIMVYSKNASRADNQQERLIKIGWII